MNDKLYIDSTCDSKLTFAEKRKADALVFAIIAFIVLVASILMAIV